MFYKLNMSRSTPIEQIPNEQHKTQITNEAEVTVQQIQQTPSLPPQQVQSLQSNYDDIHELQRELVLNTRRGDFDFVEVHRDALVLAVSLEVG